MPRTATLRRIETDTIEDAVTQELESVAAVWNGESGHIDFRPTFEQYLQTLLDLHQSFFESQTGPDGKGWEPNKPITIRRKGHGIILVENGDLAASLTSASHTDNIFDIVSEGHNQGFTFGTSAETSIFHQEGTTRGAKENVTRRAKGLEELDPTPGVPVRAHVGFTPDAVDQLVEAAADRMVEQLVK